MCVKARRPIALALALLCVACASEVHVGTDNKDQIATDFANGKINLTGETPTLAQYNESQQMHGLYLAKDWKSLSRLVLEGNYDGDLNWFYLGRSAEGLGLNDAAANYYSRALSSPHRCAGPLGDYCNGFVFPRDILQHLSRLDAHAR